MNGKGDKDRTTDYQKYQVNFEEIAWSYKGKYCADCNSEMNIDLKFGIFDEDGHFHHHNCHGNYL